MNTIRRRFIRVILTLGITLGGLVMIPNQPARADIAPPVEAPIGVPGPFQYQDTQVQMVAEQVLLELHVVGAQNYEQNPLGGASIIQVTADFSMYNPGSSDESMQAIFPLTYIRCTGPNEYIQDDYAYQIDPYKPFTVTVNGDTISTTQVATPGGEGCSEGDEIEWKAFDITFPAHQTTQVGISYIMGQRRPSRSVGFYYIL